MLAQKYTVLRFILTNMAKIYRQNCKQCGKYYERPGAKYFCSLHCANINPERIEKIKVKIPKGRITNTGRTHFKKGQNVGNTYNLGRKASEETKRKMSETHKRIGTGKWMKGKKLSKETRIKISNATKGENNHFYGKHHSEKVRRKISNHQKGIHAGEKHYNWKGGISDNPYPTEFNRELKRRIRERDNFTCQLCGRTEKEELEELNRVLSVNHIDFDKENLSPNNLNTLCLRCNVKINYNRDEYLYYFQERINCA